MPWKFTEMKKSWSTIITKIKLQLDENLKIGLY